MMGVSKRVRSACIAATLAMAGLSGPGFAAGKKTTDAAGDTGAALTAEAINGASVGPDAGKARKRAGKNPGKNERPDPLLLKTQVLLDRARFSPGAIDGRDGDNLRRALAAFAQAQGVTASDRPTPELLEKLEAASQGPVVVEYTITEADAGTAFVERIPPKMEDQAELKALGYTDAREMLAERFHMSRDLLGALNPDKPLDKAGTVILVAGVSAMAREKPDGKTPREPKVERIEVDKVSRDVRAFAKDGTLVAYYPASIGSAEKPAPSGETKVTRVAFDPTYTYDPKYAFKGVKAREKFTIRPGPNNPVGLVWIDLDIPSYGIHGTPDPEKVGKTESHGCIRLTNWSALELAGQVARGAKVAFKDR